MPFDLSHIPTQGFFWVGLAIALTAVAVPAFFLFVYYYDRSQTRKYQGPQTK